MTALGVGADDIRALAADARLPITEAQVQAIADQAAIYDSGASHAAGLHHVAIKAYPEAAPRGAVCGCFHYLQRGLPKHLGLEMTVFAPGGRTLDSQDFG